MKKTMILLFLFFHFFSNGQDWSLFNFGQKSYYAKHTEGNSFEFESFIVDSVNISDDDEVLLFNSKSLLTNDCHQEIIQYMEEHYPDMVHSKIRALHVKDDMVIFYPEFISYLDSFIFKPYSVPGDSWTTTNDNITISCTDLKVDTILGVADSTKTFTILNGPFENVEIVLSKSFGLISFVNFNSFFIQDPSEDTYELIGFENPEGKRGYTQPEFKDYFHLHAGDKLYWDEFLFAGPDSYRYYYADSILYSFLSEDSVYYEYQRKKYDFQNYHLISTSTLSDTYIASDWEKYFETSPNWFYLNGSNIYFTRDLSLQITEDDTIVKYSHSSSGPYLDTLTCELEVFIDGGQYESFSTKEGRIYTGWAGFDSEYTLTLIGSIIDGTASGTILGVNEYKNIPVKLFPNPVTSTLSIDLPKNLWNKKIDITIFNNIGQIQKSTSFQTSDKVQIDMQNFPAGTYYCQIKTDKIVFAKPVIKK